MIRLIWNFVVKWAWDFNRDLRGDSDLVQTTRRGGLNKASPQLRVSEDIESEAGLNITVRQAMGGRIVTFRAYDHKADRQHYRLYVIPEDMNFEQELCKMITMESMRG
jgi:hypothetical protein